MTILASQKRVMLREYAYAILTPDRDDSFSSLLLIPNLDDFETVFGSVRTNGIKCG